MIPRISVVIPTKDRCQYIGGAISSVLSQTFGDIEVLVVDDGSQDQTEQVVLSVRDSRVHYIRHSQPRGAASARNTGIRNAAAPLIAFLDDDDEWLQQKVELQLKLLDAASDHVGCIYTGFEILDKNLNRRIALKTPHQRGNLSQDLLEGNFIGTTSSVLFRKDYLIRCGMFDEEMRSAEDWDLFLRFAAFYKFDYVEYPLVRYRMHGTSISTNLDAVEQGFRKILEKHGKHRRLRRSCSPLFLDLGVAYAEAGRMREASRAFAMAAMLNPLASAGYFYLTSSLLGKRLYRRVQAAKAGILSSSGSSHGRVSKSQSESAPVVASENQRVKPPSVQTNTLLAVPWDIERGGMTFVVQNLANFLLAQGHDVLFFHPGNNLILKRGLTKLGFPGVRLRLNMPVGPPERRLLRVVAFPFFLTVSILQLGWLIWNQRIRIINLHYPEDSFFYFAICRYLFPIRLVTSLHGNDAFDDFGQPKDAYPLAFRFILRASDLIILPSDTYRKRLLTVLPAVEHKTIAILNGVNPGFASSNNGRNGNAREPYILCVAEHRPYKAIDILLHAFQLLLMKNRSFRLVLAGDGPLRPNLEALASALGILDQTDFLGTQTAEGVAKLLHDCEVFVLPSRADNCPIAILEAMLCRKSIVASAVGGIPELIENEKSGILVEPENPQALAEAVWRVLQDPMLREDLAGQAYSRVIEHFCFSRTGAEYESAFASFFRSS